MQALDWLAACGLAALLPIPVYWLVIHPFAGFWRRRRRAAFWVAVPVATAIAWTFLVSYRAQLMTAADAPLWRRGLGLALLVAAVGVFVRVKQEMGLERLVGQTELRGDGELRVSGLYRHVRHPNYAAQMALMLGLCVLVGTPLLWATAAGWALLLLLAIRFEERELLARFGEPYRAYRARVPAFVPRGGRCGEEGLENQKEKIENRSRAGP